MKKFYHVQYKEYDIFFDSKKRPVDWWHLNDAEWRPEYMVRLLRSAGADVFEVEDISSFSKAIESLGLP